MAATLQEKLTHAKDVATWKVDQQSRILKTQNKISDYERQINKQKMLLAESVCDLWEKGEITNPSLVPIMDELLQTQAALLNTHLELENIKNEQAPELIESFDLDEVFSGLVCPTCGKKLKGKFCPDHGVEGIEPQKSVSLPERELVCPQCGKPVPIKFCVECGAEGIPNEAKDLEQHEQETTESSIAEEDENEM